MFKDREIVVVKTADIQRGEVEGIRYDKLIEERWRI